MRSAKNYYYWMAFLGFCSGFPLLFSSQILKIWIIEQGGSLDQVGYVSYLSLPYLCAFIWMPLLDYVSASGGLKREIIISICFLLCSLSMLIVAQCFPSPHYPTVMLISVFIAIVGATQDHLIEAYRMMSLPKQYINGGVSVSIIGFRVAVMLSGGGGVLLASTYGWGVMYLCASLLMFVVGCVMFFAPPEHDVSHYVDFRQHLRCCLRFASSLFVRPSFMKFLLTHRLSVFWLEAMMPALLIRLMGLSEAEVGMTYVFYGMLGLIVGGVVANWVLRFKDVSKVMYYCCGGQVLLCALLWILCVMPSLGVFVGVVVFFECALQGVLSTLSTVWLISETNATMPAFGFSLWYGFGASGRIVAGPVAAVVIGKLGWSVYILCGALLAVYAVLACKAYFCTDYAIDSL